MKENENNIEQQDNTSTANETENKEKEFMEAEKNSMEMNARLNALEKEVQYLRGKISTEQVQPTKKIEEEYEDVE